MIAPAFVRRLWQAAAPDRRLFVHLSCLTVLDVLAQVPGPLLFAWLIERMVAGASTGELTAFAVATLVLESISAGLRIVHVRLNRRFAVQAANRLRDRFFSHLLTLPWPWFLDHQAGGQASHYLADIDDIDQAVGGLVERGLRSALALLVLGAALAVWNPLVAACAVVLLPATVYAQRALLARVRASSREKVELRQDMNGLMAEAVANPELLKSQVLEPVYDARLAAVSTRFRDAALVLETGQSALRSSASVLVIFAQYAFFVIGALLVIRGDLGLGPFLGQMLLVARLTPPLNTLLEYANSLAKSQAALSRVEETLALAPEGGGSRVLDSGDARGLGSEGRQPLDEKSTSGAQPNHGPPGSGRAPLGVEVRGLQFRHDPQLPLIEGWDLAATPGQTLAIVGPSGAGKTTLFQLLLGLVPAQGGVILFNGIPLPDLDLCALRRQVGVVFQEQEMFNTTVRENLALASEQPIDDERLWWALERAQAADFVRALPHKLDTRVGVDGIKLSGGQRQRLSIALAILKNPPLLLLDEATSALDTLAEQQIQASIKELARERTTIVIAHRLSTIVEADRIVVLDQGRIVQCGSHAELLGQEGLYRHLVTAQSEGLLGWKKLQSGAEP